MWTNRETLTIPHYLIILREIAIRPQSVTDLFENTHISYTHIHKMKGVFLDKGWATGQKEEKKIILTLTIKGYEIVDNFEALLRLLEITKVDIIEYLKAHKKRYIKKTENPNENHSSIPELH